MHAQHAARHQEKRLQQRGLLPPHLLLLCLLGALLLHWALPLGRWIPAPLSLFGLALSTAGLALSVAASGQFARMKTNINTFRPPDQLVTDGLFRYSRNPMYLGFLLVLAGAAIALGSVGALAGPVAFFLAAQFWYIPFEERACEARFGAAYAAYRGRTRRWL